MYKFYSSDHFFSRDKQIRAEAPVFLKRIGDTEVYHGMNAKFTACVTGYPEPEVEWFKNGQKLFPTEKISIDTEQNGLLRLTVHDIDENDVGRYSCRVYNPHGDDTCHAELYYDCKCLLFLLLIILQLYL